MEPSGSGTSTLMRCAAGLDSLASGSVRVGDIEVGSLTDRQLTRLRRDKAGFVFQAFNTKYGNDWPSLDCWRWAPELDIVSNDHYLRSTDPESQIYIALSGDLVRSLAGGPWLLTEHPTGAVDRQPVNRAKGPGEMRRNALAHVAHGADSRIWQDVVQLGAELRVFAEVQGSTSPAEAAIVWDWNTRWAMDRCGLTDGEGARRRGRLPLVAVCAGSGSKRMPKSIYERESCDMTSLTLAQLTERLPTDLGRPERELLAPGGSWNLSQTLQHCAQTVRYSVTGYPKPKPALFRATAGALAKRVFLRRGAMKHSLAAEIDGAPPLDPGLPVTVAAANFVDAVALFTDHTGDHAPHPTYGRCTHDEFARLHAMHFAEHLPGLADA